MKKKILVSLLGLLWMNMVISQTTIWLDDLNIPGFSEGIPSVTVKASSANQPIQLAKQTYERGLGAHSTSVLSFQLNGKATRFSAIVGADDLANPGMITRFYVIGDRKILFESGDMKTGDQPKTVSVNLTGIERLGLLVTNQEEVPRNYSDWADAKITMIGNHVPQNIPNDGEKYILTPASPKAPAIHSPKVFGARPGNPFLFSIVASGNRPMKYAIDHLPKGLSLDAATG
ncbi:MAG: NPCBM/NEW2 domain-containing protein, partial [Bacteroidota bacterium]|nr:NPCBM/NEW2 domain-containing protein [Bacteroidota bacterium]